MKIGIGVSQEKNCAEAADHALEQALKTVPGPDLAMVFASFPDHRSIHKALLKKLDPNILMGGSSYAEITNAGVTRNSVAVLLISFENARVRTAAVREQYPSPYEKGKALAQSMQGYKPEEGCSQVGLLVTNFATGYENDLLKALADHLGRVPVFGGMSCGDYDKGTTHPDFWKSHQYCGDSLTSESAKLAILDLPKKEYRLGFGFEHGWQPIGPIAELTRCKGNRVYEIDGMPIIDYYRQFISREESEKFFELDFQRYAFAAPFEKEGVAGSIIKIPVSCDFKEGCITYYPAEDLQGRKVQLILASRRSAVRGARDAAMKAKAALDGMEPALVLIVSCCSRNAILHSRINTEVDAIRDVFGRDVPVFGYYSGGEIMPFLSRYEDVIDPGRHMSGSYYHGTTIGIMALGSVKRPSSVSIPSPETCQCTVQEELSRLREIMTKSEDILDNTESFMANISRKSYKDVELITKQNEIIHRYTPHDVWKRVGDTVASGRHELSDEEFTGCFLFMDIKGFTSYSENHTSKEVVTALNKILKPATELIYKCGGDVDKYIGDCIFAAFRDPQGALEAGRGLQVLFAGLKDRGNPFSVRIGINSGRAVRANVGSRDRREYTFIGDAVNTAQRLEHNCTPGKMLISEELYELGRDRFPSAERRKILVKGKKKPLTVYEIN